MLRRGLSVLVLVLVIVTSCRSSPEAEMESPSYDAAAVDTTRPASERLDALFAHYDAEIVSAVDVDSAAAEAWVEETFESMTLDQKIGQLIMVDLSASGIRGLFGDPTGLVQNLGVGGFLVPRLMSPRDVFRTTQSLQQTSRIPLFFAADYERGVGRFNNTLTEFPSNMAIGATRDAVYAAAMGRLTAIESRAIGVNLVFAPVVDVNNNPDNPIINIRSYGEDAELVAAMASAYVREAQRYGTLTTLKHFPGHGDTAVDTHARMAVVEGSRASLDSIELRPYEVVLSQPVQPAAVMSAHLWAQALDPAARPATFSEQALTDVLRGEFGFDGLIVTDDIKMGALSGRYSTRERILNPLRAGANVILTPSDPAQAVAVIRDAVRGGDLSEQVIDESVRRVLRAKANAGLYTLNSSGEMLSYLLEEPRGGTIAQAIADEAVTVLRAPDVLPLKASTRPVLVQITNYEGSESISAAMDLLQKSHDAHDLIAAFRFEQDATQSDVARVTSATADADVVVVALYLRLIAGRGDAGVSAGQARLVEELLAGPTPVVLLTFGNPYAVSTFSSADGHVVAYDQSLETIRAVYRVLTGRLSPTGRLPITVDPYPFGSGMNSLRTSAD